MEYPESYLVADTIARDLRAKLTDLSADEITLVRDEAVLILKLVDWMIEHMNDEVRRTNERRT